MLVRQHTNFCSDFDTEMIKYFQSFLLLCPFICKFMAMHWYRNKISEKRINNYNFTQITKRILSTKLSVNQEESTYKYFEAMIGSYITLKFY